MSPRRELLAFACTLSALIAGFFHASLFGGKVLSPGDVLLATRSFATGHGDYEPANRLLMDPVLQFQPWLEFNRAELRAGRLPLWNPLAGCGAPHLANGQSAVFDPFQLIAYLGRLPDALAWMASARLFVAGLGLFLLARSWGFSGPGRWLSGLTFPFCGFLIVWLQYPVTNVAIWLPWLFLATDRALAGPGLRGVAGLAIVVGFVMLGGHVQTSAHVLLAAGVYVVWSALRTRSDPDPPSPRARCAELGRWSLGVILGLAMAAIEIVPLGSYLTRSPVWADRRAERPPILAVSRPRVLDAMTTAFPYLYGSQRRGHPNLAKVLGVHNLNESAGGFAGLATLVLLAPMAWRARRTHPRVGFLVGLAAFGAAGAFDVAPVPNLLRAIPVLNVADNRRLTLWLAFGLCLLGGIGIGEIGTFSRNRAGKRWSLALICGSALFAIAACAIVAAGPRIREKSIAHYAAAARETPGADPAAYRERAERQADNAERFLPRYYALAAAHLALIALLYSGANRVAPGSAGAARRVAALRVTLAILVLIDVVAFGYDLNPAIAPAEHRPHSEVIAYLTRECPPHARIIALGSEMPPNILMRYGLADARNYDSVELSRSLDWFEPLYEPENGRSARSSRRELRWRGVVRAKDRLRDARVSAVVATTPPPEGVFDRVDRVGDVWIARWNPPPTQIDSAIPGQIALDLRGHLGQVRWVAETYDPGWKAEIDGQATRVFPYQGCFLAVDAPPGARRLVFRYDPPEVRIAGMVSLGALLLIGIVGGAGRTARKTATKAWKRSARRVRIESMISARTPRPGSLPH